MASKSGEPSLSKYYSGLDDTAKKRYMEKLCLINNIDPYCRMESRSKKSLPGTLEWTSWPDILYADIYNYLILSPGMSHEKLKAFKSLDGYNQFINGWVSGVVVTVVPNTRPKIYLFTSQVKHSQRLSDTPLKVWVAVEENGEVLCAHCNCMAGLGEVCSHVAALLFTAEANTQVKNRTSSTSLPCAWLPPSFQTVPFAQVADIDFTTPRSKRKATARELNEDNVNTDEDDNDVSANVVAASSSSISSNLKPQESAIAKFFRQLSTKTSGKPVILSLVPEYADAYIPKTLTSNFPRPLSELFDPNTVNLTFDELLTKCEEVYDTFTITRDEVKVVEANTRKQAKCGIWFHQRAGRVTASKFKNAVRTDPTQPSVSLIKSICYPTRSFKSAACEYGCKHENNARKEYEYAMKQQHQSFSVKESGLILDPMYPFVGASPDGIITCTCCGTGVLEIKCPYSCKNKGLKEVSEEKSCFFLRVTETGHLELKDNHQYFYQVQLQMKLCNTSYCDFVVWSKNQGILVQRLFPDAEFIERALKQVENFIKCGILPELVSNWYTKSRVPSKVLSTCASSSSAATMSSCSAMSSTTAAVTSCSATSVCVSSSSTATMSSSLSECVPSTSAVSCSATSACVLSCSTATVSSSSAMSECTSSSSAATVSSCFTISVQSSSDESLPPQSTVSVIVPSHKRSVPNFHSEKTWCYCGEDESYDKMIACEHPDCEVEWFHYSCVGLTEELVPDGDWFCSDCQMLTRRIKRHKKQ